MGAGWGSLIPRISETFFLEFDQGLADLELLLGGAELLLEQGDLMILGVELGLAAALDGGDTRGAVGRASFTHHPAATLPELDDRGVHVRVLAGSAYGVSSPIPVSSPLFYVEVKLEPSARIEAPREHEERAVYVVSGELRCGSSVVRASTMAVLRPHHATVLEATVATHLVMIGGAPLDGPRWIWWNFVSSSKERIEQAASDWKEGRFPRVPGDEIEFIPLLDTPRFAGG